jgi:FkbH-like protein
MQKEQFRQITELLQTIRDAQSAGLLGDCQDGAISIGEYIESIEGVGTTAVALIEEYCEVLYKASLGKATDEEIECALSQVENCVRRDFGFAAENAAVAGEQIKLVIWDLDDTFWNGTLAEGTFAGIPKSNADIVIELARRGIVSSICSKNDFEQARNILEQTGSWGYFVFPRIAFQPKGEAVKQIISDMQLRAPNVLFIDDNFLNIEEVAFYNPEIQTLRAEQIPAMLSSPQLAGKPDLELLRLKQYKMLEERHIVKQSSESNEDFLRTSNIHIEIAPAKPADTDRIYDMIMRTNQLNFTKKRISRGELESLLRDNSAESATVRVYDRFGDHGVIGWYYLKDGELFHFLFSCRTINLGIEQFIYAYLGHPKIELRGETASPISSGDVMPEYISLAPPISAEDASHKPGGLRAIPAGDKISIYALGACDLYYLVGHMALPLTNVHFECNTFRGDARGVNVGTEYIRSCFEIDDERKEYCRKHFHNYTGSAAFDTRLLSQAYDYVCLSFHDEFQLEVYQSKRYPNLRVLLSNSKTGSFTPILNPDNIPDFDTQNWLASEFAPLGYITPERFLENLNFIYERLPDTTTLVLMTGPEYDYFRDTEPHNAKFRQQIVKINAVIRGFARNTPRTKLVEMNDYIFDRNHFTNFIMHLKPERGFLLAMDMLSKMAESPCGKNPFRSFPVNGRKICLWAVDGYAAPFYFALSAGGARPELVIGGRDLKNIANTNDTIVLSGKNSEYFVGIPPAKTRTKPSPRL